MISNESESESDSEHESNYETCSDSLSESSSDNIDKTKGDHNLGLLLEGKYILINNIIFQGYSFSYKDILNKHKNWFLKQEQE